MNDAITGGCMCGSVRYRLSEGLRFSLFCQCRDCQRITGSGHSALIFFHAATLDQPERFAPTRAIWARSAQPWDALPPDLPTET